MVKKISVFIMILGLFFVGIPQPKVNASYASDNAYYLTRSWDYWDYDGDNTDWRILYADYTADIHLESNLQLVSNLFMENKTAIWGSKDVVINLGGTYEVWFVDNWNMPFSQNRYYFGQTDNILITPSVLFASDNGRRYSKSKNSILQELNADDFYIVIQDLNADFNAGFYEGNKTGFQQGEKYGYGQGKSDYGIFYNADWRTADWYGNYQYNKGLNETDATGFIGLLTAVFAGLGALLGIEILPGIYIGAIIAVPLVFGIIFFILGKRKGD